MHVLNGLIDVWNYFLYMPERKSLANKYKHILSLITYLQFTKLHFCAQFMKFLWAEELIVTLSTIAKPRPQMYHPYCWVFFMSWRLGVQNFLSGKD
jgi:hypothetical protein